MRVSSRIGLPSEHRKERGQPHGRQRLVLAERARQRLAQDLREHL